MAVRDFDMDPERNVLNTKDPDDNTGFVIKTDENKRKLMRSSRYESVEFTDTSISYNEPFEDEALISGQVKPEVAAVYDTGYDGKPNVYDPSKDHVSEIKHGDSFDKTSSMGILTKESFSTPEFFKRPVDLIIGCVIFGLIIILEIVGLIIVF
ncbi:MAG: hypothetical protein IK142_05685 [Clostridiales bacterium]|nr:hypothetical protein [Clostridiales bacterium]